MNIVTKFVQNAVWNRDECRDKQISTSSANDYIDSKTKWEYNELLSTSEEFNQTSIKFDENHRLQRN